MEQEVRSYRDLVVWQRAIELSLEIYSLTRSFPKEELYGLKSQLQRASVSIASNIAEGSGRRSTGEFLQFLGTARGSNYELQTQLVIARKLGYGTSDAFVQCDSLSFEVERMLNALMNRLST